ncbi:MAG: Rrf2 family transcriptional regulator [Chloroflexi bacterium]|nr:Rrf2 family transcriptional regulator [Chloroflexota bacterium]
MELSRGTNYAFHALMALAQAPEGRPLGVAAVARSLGTSPTYLAKLLSPLARAGVVGATRGSGGGYTLARPAGEITLRQVVEVLQGPVVLDSTLPNCATCPWAKACPMKQTFHRSRTGLLAELSSITVAGMLAAQIH